MILETGRVIWDRVDMKLGSGSCAPRRMPSYTDFGAKGQRGPITLLTPLSRQLTRCVTIVYSFRATLRSGEYRRTIA
jgi:hypothetical protein